MTKEKRECPACKGDNDYETENGCFCLECGEIFE